MKVLWLLFGLALLAGAQEALTDDSIVKMVQSGLGENLIVSVVQSQPGRYSVTTDDLVKLKQEGVSETVLAAMVSKGSVSGAPAQVVVVPGGLADPSGATPGPGSIAAGDPNDPLVPHDSGIWIYTKDRDAKPQMIVLERAAYQGAKTGGVFASAMTGGIMKMKIKAVIPGAHASIRIADAHPVFYFYFDDRPAGLGKTYFGVAGLSNANQFALVKLEASKSDRETIIGQVGAFGGSSGTQEKSIIEFKSERIRTGLYKVTIDDSLPTGEYCFLASGGMMTRGVAVRDGSFGTYGAGAANAGDIFDFGVEASK